MLRLAADAVLLVHALFVLFVVAGLALVLVGGVRGWGWVRNFYFRLAHLLAIGFVVMQSWAGGICPLTRWESMLRQAAGDEFYTGSFITHWVQRLLYYQAPAWVFALCYTLFAALVVASWWWLPPIRRTPAGLLNDEGKK